MLEQTHSVLKIMAVSIYFPGVQFIFRINVIKYLFLHFQTMEKLVTKLAHYQFLTAFPQLISRICHSHPEVFQQLLVKKEIFACLLTCVELLRLHVCLK